MSDKPLAHSTLKHRRRKNPVFVDEPIQWHLRNGKHDRCPWCGLQEMVRRGGKKRICENEVCRATYEISMSPTEWGEHKMFGFEEETGIDISSNVDFSWVVDGDDQVYTLEQAQLRSDSERAFVRFANGYVLAGTMKVYWHRVGKLPERKDASPACAGGSNYWREILALRTEEVWVPEIPLNEMEVLAKAFDSGLKAAQKAARMDG